MSFVILDPNDTTVPVNADGEEYRHILIRADETIAGDSVTDLLEAIIDGYDQIDHTPEGDVEALGLRYDAAVHVANLAQMAQNEYVGIPEGITDDEYVALTADRSSPLAMDFEWTLDPTLVLVATDYAPYTDIPAPEGNVHFINPHTEESFLLTTSDVGVWSYMSKAHSAQDADDTESE